jgi:hypothetical protein
MSALASMGMGEHVGSFIPTPSMSNNSDINQEELLQNANIQEDIPQWENPESNDEEVASEEFEEPKYITKQKKSLSQMHPVLKKLRQEFGLDTIKTISIKIGSISWTMRAINQEQMTFALRLADMYSASQSEHVLKLTMARVSCAIVAIDNTPVYKLFNIKLEKDEKISDYLNPPPRIKQLSAIHVYDLLMQESIPGLGKHLADIYEEKLVPETDVTLDNEFKSVYRCTNEECNEEKKLIDRVIEGGEKQPYFCQLCGSVMNPVLTSQEASNSPLE